MEIYRFDNSVIFVNGNENEKMMQTKKKLKRENRKRLKTKTLKQQNLSLNESASIQYGAYGCYGRTALIRD